MQMNSDIIDKIRQQYNTGPYPRVALEQSPKNEGYQLFIHNLVTAYYLRNQKVINTKNKVILDAGCGSGYASLVLAEANPEAKIIGVDLSKESIILAQDRLKYHGFEQAEFYVLDIENLDQLGIKFDYINCDDVLYFLPDPVLGLQAMKSVLNPEGIIRGNLHSSIQRFHYYKAQELFKTIGCLDENPGELQIEFVRETMKALKDHVFHKAIIWKSEFEKDDERILMNYLVQGDKGYTVPEMFSTLKAAELEFISMVNWRQWDLMDLFKTPEDLPIFLGMTLPEMTCEEQMHIYELLHPIHRLLDFWCGNPQQNQAFLPVAEWQLSDWESAKVHLHPQLKTDTVKSELIQAIMQMQNFDISRHLRLVEESIFVDSLMAACLLRLWDAAHSIKSLVQLWLKLRPLHPITLEPATEKEALTTVIQALTWLESHGYVLLELQT